MPLGESPFDDDIGFRERGKPKSQGFPGLYEVHLNFATAASWLAGYKTAQTVFRTENSGDLIGNPGPQYRLGRRRVALPAFLGAHCHDSIGKLQEMRFARSICAYDYIETFGEFQVGLFEGRKVLEHERLDH
ncbi:MAG: hypothetical protein OXC26_09805 [Albidovulum sp.]|nr:hypothetical protein [Albidovulum sp.]